MCAWKGNPGERGLVNPFCGLLRSFTISSWTNRHPLGSVSVKTWMSVGSYDKKPKNTKGSPFQATILFCSKSPVCERSLGIITFNVGYCPILQVRKMKENLWLGLTGGCVRACSLWSMTLKWMCCPMKHQYIWTNIKNACYAFIWSTPPLGHINVSPSFIKVIASIKRHQMTCFRW